MAGYLVIYSKVLNQQPKYYYIEADSIEWARRKWLAQEFNMSRFEVDRDEKNWGYEWKWYLGANGYGTNGYGTSKEQGTIVIVPADAQELSVGTFDVIMPTDRTDSSSKD